MKEGLNLESISQVDSISGSAGAVVPYQPCSSPLSLITMDKYVRRVDIFISGDKAVHTLRVERDSQIIPDNCRRYEIPYYRGIVRYSDTVETRAPEDGT